MDALTLEPRGNGVQAIRSLSLGDTVAQIMFLATDIRRERTGIHAQVIIGQGTTALDHHTFNISRSDERIRLANSAYKGVSAALHPQYNAQDMKHDLDIFCLRLWDSHVSALPPALTHPDEAPTEIAMLLKPFILAEGGTIMFGPPGIGKSYTAQLLAVSVDAGCSLLWPCTQANVCYVNLERSTQSIRRRLLGINTALGLDPHRPLLCINRRGANLLDIADLLRQTIMKYGVRLLILDSLSRTGMGDLTENLPVNKAMDLLNNLCPAWLALGHSPRATDDHIYGGIHFDAAADVIVQILSQQTESKLGVGLQVVKANDMKVPPMSTVAYEFDVYGLKNARRANPREFLEIDARRKQSMEDEIASYLMDAGPKDAATIAHAIGRNRSNVANLLPRSPLFVAVAHEGHRQLYFLADRSLA